MMSLMKKILLIDDEPRHVVTLVDRLESEGFLVDSAENGANGLACALSHSYDLIIQDVSLPDMDGFEVCRTLRWEREHLPILLLTARSQTIDKVLGLKLGADDYLTKPFEMSELIARIQALLRRTSPVNSRMRTLHFRFADIEVDFRRAEIRKADELLDCSAKEFQLLRHFIKHQGQVLSRKEILNNVWGYSTVPSTRTVDVHVARLRQKIERNPRKPEHLLTVHNMGYRFDG